MLFKLCRRALPPATAEEEDDRRAARVMGLVFRFENIDIQFHVTDLLVDVGSGVRELRRIGGTSVPGSCLLCRAGRNDHGECQQGHYWFRHGRFSFVGKGDSSSTSTHAIVAAAIVEASRTRR